MDAITQPHYLRVQDELRRLMERSNIQTSLIAEGTGYVLYHSIETSGAQKGLPSNTSVLVPIPDGYPSAQIDMPALPSDSPLIPFVVGGSNPQATISIDGVTWKTLSYHPYNGGGGPPWNFMVHGFHDYYTHLYTWLHRLL
jgi:hypothetical protein